MLADLAILAARVEASRLQAEAKAEAERAREQRLVDIESRLLALEHRASKTAKAGKALATGLADTQKRVAALRSGLDDLTKSVRRMAEWQRQPAQTIDIYDLKMQLEMLGD